MTFFQELHQQRWDDHRFYHHNLVNQSLHAFSACTFLACYALFPFDPGLASFFAWTLAMVSRQSGHFFFEPKDYDEVNGVTHEHKEEVKTGFNLFRKWILMGIWIASPLVLLASPNLLGLIRPAHHPVEVLRNIGYVWLILAMVAVAIRVTQLTVKQSFQTGVCWAIKILTDPFSDLKLYHSSPLRLLRGEPADGHGGLANAAE
jgi:hypothetical protein